MPAEPQMTAQERDMLEYLENLQTTNPAEYERGRVALHRATRDAPIESLLRQVREPPQRLESRVVGLGTAQALAHLALAALAAAQALAHLALTTSQVGKRV